MTAATIPVVLGSWNPKLHPRSPVGRFVTKGGGGFADTARSADRVNDSPFREVPAEDFHRAFAEARKKLPPMQAACLTPYGVDDLANMRCFLAHDGKVGGALKRNGDRLEAVSLFNAGGPRGSGVEILNHLRDQGANQLDCIGEPLARIYADHGWKVTERMDWDWKYAPKGWKKSWGEPKVFVMQIDPDKPEPNPLSRHESAAIGAHIAAAEFGGRHRPLARRGPPPFTPKKRRRHA